ncbi:MAG: tripartite tricarboxylate transporter substrate binding protein [Betaproteobacteria bacterium]|nr:tripartite tricarboxylate transporter substrate binding protein [Betaproteobacteria bacterium]
MKISNRLLRQLCTVFSLVLCVSVTGAASAQPYPNKAIRLIVAAPPGGTADFLSRILGQNLASVFGQQVVIDNRGGANGIIGENIAAKASPDGYTLLVVPSSYVINPFLYSKVGYDLVKDFAPITQFAAGAWFVVAHPSVPVKTIKEFIAFAKSKKGALTYASTGTGSVGHLGTELLRTLAGFDAVHVPYTGTAPTMVALMAGQADASIVPAIAAVPQAKAGKLKALAVTLLQRSVLLPDVPTVAESGFPGFEVNGWQGLLAPAGTPREVMARLFQEVSRILKLPDVRDRMVASGSDPVGSRPEEFAAYIKVETIKWAKVIKQSGARVD